MWDPSTSEARSSREMAEEERKLRRSLDVEVGSPQDALASCVRAQRKAAYAHPTFPHARCFFFVSLTQGEGLSLRFLLRMVSTSPAEFDTAGPVLPECRCPRFTRARARGFCCRGRVEGHLWSRTRSGGHATLIKKASCVAFAGPSDVCATDDKSKHVRHDVKR